VERNGMSSDSVVIISLGKVTIRNAVERLHHEFTERKDGDLQVDFDIVDDEVDEFEAMLKALGVKPHSNCVR
jgi:hypothetical protein